MAHGEIINEYETVRVEHPWFEYGFGYYYVLNGNVVGFVYKLRDGYVSWIIDYPLEEKGVKELLNNAEEGDVNFGSSDIFDTLEQAEADIRGVTAKNGTRVGAGTNSKGLMTMDSDVWDDLNISSGSELYSDEELQKKYAKELDSRLKKKGVGILSERIYDGLENWNYHSLNSALTWMGYYGKENTDRQLEFHKKFQSSLRLKPEIFLAYNKQYNSMAAHGEVICGYTTNRIEHSITVSITKIVNGLSGAMLGFIGSTGSWESFTEYGRIRVVLFKRFKLDTLVFSIVDKARCLKQYAHWENHGGRGELEYLDGYSPDLIQATINALNENGYKVEASRLVGSKVKASDGMFMEGEFDKIVAEVKKYLDTVPYIWTKGNKKYVPIEGWQYAAALMGLTSRVVDIKPIPEKHGWLAQAEVVNKQGIVVCSGFGFVGRDEKKWEKAIESELESFAQTRSVSRALRNCISYVIKAAGYSTTPAEEMYGIEGNKSFTKPAGSNKGVSPIRPIVGVNVTDGMTRPEHKDVVQPPVVKVTKVEPGSLETILMAVWSEAKGNNIVLVDAGYMQGIEDSLMGGLTETGYHKMLQKILGWLIDNNIVLKSKPFMKKIKEALNEEEKVGTTHENDYDGMFKILNTFNPKRTTWQLKDVVKLGELSNGTYAIRYMHRGEDRYIWLFFDKDKKFIGMTYMQGAFQDTLDSMGVNDLIPNPEIVISTSLVSPEDKINDYEQAFEKFLQDNIYNK